MKSLRIFLTSYLAVVTYSWLYGVQNLNAKHHRYLSFPKSDPFNLTRWYSFGVVFCPSLTGHVLGFLYTKDYYTDHP